MLVGEAQRSSAHPHPDVPCSRLAIRVVDPAYGMILHHEQRARVTSVSTPMTHGRRVNQSAPCVCLLQTHPLSSTMSCIANH